MQLKTAIGVSNLSRVFPKTLVARCSSASCASHTGAAKKGKWSDGRRSISFT
jgi:hypothetical protein